MGYFLIGTVWCIVWGFVVNKVIENKGYQENWFWWGFFFGVFALIVAVTKQNVQNHSELTIVEQPAKPENVPELCIGEISIDKIDINSSIHIVSWNVQKESSTDCSISIDFFNLSPKTITAVLFAAEGLTSFDDPILINGEKTFEILGQDICVEPGRHCHIKSSLPNRDIRKVRLATKKICFSDGEIALPQPSCWIETKQKAIDLKYADCLKRKNSQGAYHAIIEEKYWQCTCGLVNVGHSCVACGMSKLAAGEFTTDRIENTHQQYLKLLEAESRVEDERKRAAAQKAEEDALKAKKAKKACVIRWVIAACVILIGVAIFVGISHAQKEREYQAEMVQIANFIETEEYDAAFSIMISSKSYKKIANTHGALLWKNQIEIDEKFCYQALNYEYEPRAVYQPEYSRNGICFYRGDGKNNYGRFAYVYAVFEDGQKQELFKRQCYNANDRVYINGMGGTDDEDDYAIWSNEWMFFSVTVSGDSWSSGTDCYALKYDKEQNKAITVLLPEDVVKANFFYKMKDGNILMAEEARVGADRLWLFDVVKGTVQEVTHGQYAKIYGSITEQQENTLYQKNSKYEGLHYDH